jgi:hypothetical protein
VTFWDRETADVAFDMYPTNWNLGGVRSFNNVLCIVITQGEPGLLVSDLPLNGNGRWTGDECQFVFGSVALRAGVILSMLN